MTFAMKMKESNEVAVLSNIVSSVKRVRDKFTEQDMLLICNYSVTLRNPQFLHKVEKWEGSEKNQRNVNIQEEKKVVC